MKKVAFDDLPNEVKASFERAHKLCSDIAKFCRKRFAKKNSKAEIVMALAEAFTCCARAADCSPDALVGMFTSYMGKAYGDVAVVRSRSFCNEAEMREAIEGEQAPLGFVPKRTIH